MDHCPLYRQEQIWRRAGLTLPRNTTCAWVLKAADLCEPLYEALKGEIIAGDYVQADETTVQVLQEPGKKNTTKSYMWFYASGPPSTPCIVLDYQPSRSQVHPTQWLKGFKGTLQTDMYAGYRHVVAQNGLTHLGCMAHGRRPFAELAKLVKTPGLAHEALAYFQHLYGIEVQARQAGLTDEARYELRQEKSVPLLKEFHGWLVWAKTQAPSGLKISEAIQYLLTHWDKLTAYCQAGHYAIDNNPLENLIRPFTVGRRNWLFKGSPRGAKAGAILYSLITTCQANGIEPYRYLRQCFEHIRQCRTPQDYRELLPQYVKIAPVN